MNPHTLLVEAAERWGTPLYVTDLDAASSAAHAWRDALPGALVAYAVKANPDPALLRRLATDGFGFEVVGPVELALALRAGGTPERIVVNGVGQTDGDLAAALATGALVNAESLGALAALIAAGGPGRIGLRINPGLDADTHPHLATGSADAKFGIALDELPAALASLRSAGIRPWSIGAHIGSAIADPEPFGRLAELLHRLADEAGAERIDLGGGFAGSPGSGRRDPAASARSGAPDRRAGTQHRARCGLAAHPGRPCAGARPPDRRCRHDRAAAPDALRRPPSRDGPHARRPAAVRRSRLDALGSRLRGGGRAGERSRGRRDGEGALLAIGEAGAYGAAMASNYNGRLRPAQAVIEGGELRLSRRRETLEDPRPRRVTAGRPPRARRPVLGSGDARAPSKPGGH